MQIAGFLFGRARVYNNLGKEIIFCKLCRAVLCKSSQSSAFATLCCGLFVAIPREISGTIVLFMKITTYR